MNARKGKTTRSNFARNTQRRPRVAAAMEPLEQRLLLSGTITSTLDSLGNLSIVGGAEANDISIVKNGNSVIITRNDGEAFAGAGTNAGETRVINNVTRNIRISLLGGADRLTLGVAGGQFWVGDVSDYDEDVQDSPWNPRDLTIDLGNGILGDGADVLTLVAPVCRNLDIKTGAGNNIINIRDNGGGNQLESSALIAGKLTITNGNDGCTIDLAGMLVIRDATIAMGNSLANSNSLTIREDTAVDDFDVPAPTFPSRFMGKLAITGGTGTDTVNLGSAAADDPMLVDGDLSVSLGTAPLLSRNSLTLAAVNVDGNFSYSGGAGADQVTVQRDNLSVIGTLSFSMFAGANSLTIAQDVEIYSEAGDITYNGGIDADTIAGGALDSIRNITLNMGAGLNNVTLTFPHEDDSAIAADRNFIYSGTDGNDTLALSGERAWSGRDFIVRMGNGDNVFSFENLKAVEVGRNLTYSGGTGSDDVTGGSLWVGGSVSIALGAGENSFSAVSDEDSAFLIVQNLSVTGTTGSDTVSLSFSSTMDSIIGGKFILNLGAGENELTVDGAGGLSVIGDFSYTGLTDADTINFLNEVYIVGDMTVKMGDGENDLYQGADTTELNVEGNFSYTGGKGVDTVEADGTVWIAGDATIALGEGATNAVHLNGDEFSVRGAFTCSAGAGADTIQLDTDAEIYGNAAFRLGAGDNMLTLWGFTAGRNFSYDGGAGVDTLDVRQLDVRRDTTIRTGEGNDVVALYDDCSFRKFTLDAAGGNDKAYLGDNSLRSGQNHVITYGMVVFKDNATVRLGAGNDEAYLGYTPVDDNLTALFLGELVSADGGVGTDSHDIGNVLFLFQPTATGFED